MAFVLARLFSPFTRSPLALRGSKRLKEGFYPHCDIPHCESLTVNPSLWGLSLTPITCSHHWPNLPSQITFMIQCDIGKGGKGDLPCL